MYVLLVACGAIAAGFSAGSAAADGPAGRTALIKGYVRVCTAGCHVQGFGICTPSQGCVTADRVAAVNADRRRVATVHLHDHRFKLALVPGRYTLELLGDGKWVHGEVMERKKARARGYRTTAVVFSFSPPY